LQAYQSELISPDDPVLCLITGSGLKDINAAMKAVPQAQVIEPNMAALKKIL